MASVIFSAAKANEEAGAWSTPTSSGAAFMWVAFRAYRTTGCRRRPARRSCDLRAGRGGEARRKKPLLLCQADEDALCDDASDALLFVALLFVFEAHGKQSLARLGTGDLERSAWQQAAPL